MTLFAFRGVKSHEWTFYDPITVDYHLRHDESCIYSLILNKAGILMSKWYAIQVEENSLIYQSVISPTLLEMRIICSFVRKLPLSVKS